MTDIGPNRRDMLRNTAGLAGASLLGLLNISPALAAEMGKVAGRSEKPLKAAFSNLGLKLSWCAQGKQAAEYWGKLFNVDVTWFDGELSDAKQRAAIEDIASQKWDFVAIQPFSIDTLAAPVERVLALAGLLNACCRSGAAFGTSSIGEHIGKQRRGAVQVTGLAIGHRLCFGI
jgi:ribose transport system substrate-binding protein